MTNQLINTLSSFTGSKNVVLKNRIQPPVHRRTGAGFSLIELLIVIAILGIIAAVAVPSYQQFLIKERRIDAHHLLLANASRLTKCFTLAGSYDASCNLLTTSKEGYYTLSTDITATTWTNSAVPVAGQSQANDTECTSITFNHIGFKSAAGSNAENCWN